MNTNTRLMKQALLLMILIQLSYGLKAEPIQSLLRVPFGQICQIKAEFIEKPNTYYAQNMCHSDYYLKIIEIDGKKLPEPLITEPVHQNITFEKNKIYLLKAYETVESEGTPYGWETNHTQFNYTIRHKIVIKPITAPS